jgi:hypothetical protein
MNVLTIDKILQMPIREVAALSPAILYDVIQQSEAKYRNAQLLKDWLHAALTMKYGKIVADLRKQQRVAIGEVQIKDDAFILKHNLPEEITWNQQLLKNAASAIASIHKDPADYIDCLFSVAEAKYRVLPSVIRNFVEPARIIKYGYATFCLEPSQKITPQENTF